MSKYKIEATIPTTQYGNLRPTFEVESPAEEEAALATLKSLWQRFGESPLKDKGGGTEVKSTGIQVTSYTGELLMWNEATHTYTDMAGNVLLSGSRYADMHSPKFDLEMMLPKTANAWEVDKEDLRGIWKMNGDISMNWGSAIHQALEVYHKYHRVGKNIQDKKQLNDNYILPKQPHLRKVVTEFIELYGADAESEVLISDIKNGMAGTIDRLEIVDFETKVCRIGDYKTNAEMDKKKLLKYQKQLSFYAHILINHGWTVQGLDLYYLNTEEGWECVEMEVLDLE